MIEVREATIEEIPLVRQIMLEAFEEYRGVLDPPSGALTETLEETLANVARGGAILAFVSGEAVGSGRYERMPDHLYRSRISVLPSHRGQGLAGAMLSFMDDLARQHGFDEIRLSTREVMESNQRLYLRRGYEIVGREKHPKGEGIVLMLAKRLS